MEKRIEAAVEPNLEQEAESKAVIIFGMNGLNVDQLQDSDESVRKWVKEKLHVMDC